MGPTDQAMLSMGPIPLTNYQRNQVLGDCYCPGDLDGVCVGQGDAHVTESTDFAYNRLSGVCGALHQLELCNGDTRVGSEGLDDVIGCCASVYRSGGLRIGLINSSNERAQRGTRSVPIGCGGVAGLDYKANVSFTPKPLLPDSKSQCKKGG